MKLLVTGGAGYLGSELALRAQSLGWDVLATRLERKPPHGRPVRLDVRDDEEVHRCLLRHGPDAVIHTAYRQADAEVRETVVRGTRNVALAAHRVGARLVNLSTDLVFDGKRPGRYAEDDEPRPVSLYGDAKLAAERLVAELYPQALVVRTSLLYGKPGPQERLALADGVVFHSDEIRTPIRVDDLAAALLELAQRDELAGILHVAGPDAVSRHELARLLAATQGRDPDELDAAPAPPGRARNVALDSSRAEALLSAEIRGVHDVLRPL